MNHDALEELTSPARHHHDPVRPLFGLRAWQDNLRPVE